MLCTYSSSQSSNFCANIASSFIGFSGGITCEGWGLYEAILLLSSHFATIFLPIAVVLEVPMVVLSLLPVYALGANHYIVLTFLIHSDHRHKFAHVVLLSSSRGLKSFGHLEIEGYEYCTLPPCHKFLPMLFSHVGSHSTQYFHYVLCDHAQLLWLMVVCHVPIYLSTVL